MLPPIRDAAAFDKLNTSRLTEKTAPVMQAVRQIRAGLSREGFDATALIGFAGAPFTVACYMTEGMDSRDFSATRTLAWRDPVLFDRIMELLIETTITYLSAQIEAGAETVMLFDSMGRRAGAFAVPSIRDRTGSAHHASHCGERHPSVPVIGFPRMAGLTIEAYARETGRACGWSGYRRRHDACGAVAASERRGARQFGSVGAGRGGQALAGETQAILAAMRDQPFIFNLGHGIVPETPPEHVAALIELVRASESRDRIVQSGRTGQPRRGLAVSAQPVLGPGDLAGAVARCVSFWRGIIARARLARDRELSPVGRQVAAAGA